MSACWPLRVESQTILDGCGPDTPRSEVVWAALVAVCDRLDYFEQLPILRSIPKPWSTFGGEHRRIDCDHVGLHIRSAGKGSPVVVPVVAFTELADLATLDRVGEDLHRRVRVAAVGRDWRECDRLLAWVWQRCRPGAPDEQLCLLDVIGAAP